MQVKLADGSVGIVPLSIHHDRAAFACGKAMLDRYLHEQATQDIRRGVASVFIACALERPALILGYFTLSAASISPSDLPKDIAKRLPRHAIPAALIGRLAVDQSVARRGLGAILIADAVAKAAQAAESVAMSAIIVDPIDSQALAFYAAHGFRSLKGLQHRMFLTLPRRAV